MPLRTPAQISSVAEYKKLIQADAKALAATGAKFQSFTKFTFGDKTTSPVIFFGIIPAPLLPVITKQGIGPASGTASINGADEIELEVAKGTVPFGALSRALKGFGVARKLVIPLGAEDGENPAPPVTTPASAQGPGGVKPQVLPPLPRTPAPVGGRPAVQNPTGTPPPANTPPPRGAVPPVGVRPAAPQPAATPARPTNVAPPRPARPPGSAAPTNTPPPTAARPPTTQPQGVAKPTAAAVPKKADGPAAPQAKPATAPTAQTPEKLFRARFTNLKARYEIALRAEPNGSFKSNFDGMLGAAKRADWTGALAEAAKLENAINKSSFRQVKAVKQQNRAARLTETFGAVKKSYFTPGSADRIAREKLSAGTHFKAFLSAQKAFEAARDEKTLDALEAAARAYSEHFQKDFSAKDQKKSENVRKNEICQTALKAARHFRLALEQDKIGPPPWDEEKEMRSAELYTKLLFEQDDKMATPNDPAAGVNGAFWLEKTVWGDKPGDTEQKKTFIFKPADVEAPVAGFPQGGSAAREMIGKTIGDQLQAAMGLDFAVPETTVVTVDSSKLPDSAGQPGPAGVPRSGSIQHFAKSKGELKKLAEKDPSILASIPDDEIQKMAVLDLVQLNMDRHSGNFMVGEKDGAGGKTPRLVPIDNGLCLPSRTGLAGRRTMLGSPHNALGDLPGAQKKMAPEMAEKIQQIDPDEVVAGMKKAYEALKKLHPEAAASAEITEENFELTKRSIQFLKKAATELTVAELQDAYVSNLEEIFYSAPDKMEAGFDAAIKASKARTPILKELAALQQDRPKFTAHLLSLGWGIDVSVQGFDGWVRMNPEKVLKAYKGNIVNPAAAKEIAELKQDLQHLDPKALVPAKPGLDSEIRHLRMKLASRPAREHPLARAYGLKDAKMEDVLKLEIFRDLGGVEKLKELAPNGESLALDARLELMMKKPLADLGGEEELKKVIKLFPQTPHKTPTQKFKMLKAWKEYQQMGGDTVYFRSGGDVQNQSVIGRVEELKCMQQLA